MKNPELTELKKARQMLAAWKVEFRKAGNKVMWHECSKVEKVVKNTPERKDKLLLLNHALDVLHGRFSKYEITK
jgi:hypothetical protein